MAMLFMDGFDKYGPVGQAAPTVASLLQAEGWTGVGSSVVMVTGLSSGGNALLVPSSVLGTSRFFGSNLSRSIGGLRFSVASLAGPTFIGFQDAGTYQCSITVNTTTGTLSIRTGSYNGTVIATSIGSVTTNSTHYLEWDITFAAAGAYQVWLDGVSIMSGTGNTKTTANNFANTFGIQPSSVGTGATFDDLYLFDSTGATCNAPLLNNPIVETALPNADVQKQWTAGATIIGNDNSATALTNPPGANQIFLRQFTAPTSMTLNSVSCMPIATSGAAKFKAVLYAGITAGAARIAEGTEVIGTVNGVTLTAPFAAGQSLTGGVAYTIGFITDTSVSLAASDTLATGSKAANTYTSNSPATLPAMTTGQASWEMWGNCTGAAVNYASLINNPAIDDIAYVSSSTVGQEDLYSFPVLSNNPASISCVAYKARTKRSDAGTRTVEMHCASGSADSAGSLAAVAPGSSFGWLDTYFPLDPNTGLAWSGSAVNAASAGPKVVS